VGALNTNFTTQSPATRIDRLGGVTVTLPAPFEQPSVGLPTMDEREPGLVRIRV